jgi:hypothetical protein
VTGRLRVETAVREGSAKRRCARAVRGRLRVRCEARAVRCEGCAGAQGVRDGGARRLFGGTSQENVAPHASSLYTMCMFFLSR